MPVPKGTRVGGRKKGVRNKKTQELIAKVETSGLMPVDYLLSVMRDESIDRCQRIDASKAVAPYIHPKLANIELTGKDGGPLQVNVVQFCNSAKQLDSTGLSTTSVVSPRTGLPPRRAVLA